MTTENVEDLHIPAGLLQIAHRHGMNCWTNHEYSHELLDQLSYVVFAVRHFFFFFSIFTRTRVGLCRPWVRCLRNRSASECGVSPQFLESYVAEQRYVPRSDWIIGKIGAPSGKARPGSEEFRYSECARNIISDQAFLLQNCPDVACWFWTSASMQ